MAFKMDYLGGRYRVSLTAKGIKAKPLAGGDEMGASMLEFECAIKLEAMRGEYLPSRDWTERALAQALGVEVDWPQPDDDYDPDKIY